MAGERRDVVGSARVAPETAAPLWSGLFALVNAAAGKPVGPGWDACTGLGTPKGAAIVQAFATNRG